jgi:hypothetical protein
MKWRDEDKKEQSMKKKNVGMTLGVLATALSFSLASPGAGAVEVGIGVGIFGEDGGTIYVPIKFGNFRIEPEFSFNHYNSDRTHTVTPTQSFESESTSISIGSGIYLRQQVGSSLETFIGGRVGLYRSEYSSTYPNNPASNYSSETTGIYLGPTVGAEYFFTKQFSLGLDASLIFSSSSRDYQSNNPYDEDQQGFNTEGRVTVRYYF